MENKGKNKKIQKEDKTQDIMSRHESKVGEIR